MEFKYFNNSPLRLFLVSFIITFIGCSEQEKSNTSNTYYIEIVNFNDSLKNYISENIFGKVSFYKNKKLEIISLNYITDYFPDMHFFKSTATIDKAVKADTKKIKIEFSGNYSMDSISYSLQKYTYNNKQWVKTSDMGIVKATSTYKKESFFIIKDFGNQIINNTVVYSYN